MLQLTFVLDGYLLGDDSVRNVGLLGNFLAKINVVKNKVDILLCHKVPWDDVRSVYS